MLSELTVRNMFATQGRFAEPLAFLGAIFLALSILAVVVVSVLLLIALFRRRPVDLEESESDRFARFESSERRARRWILTGTAISIVLLMGGFAVTLGVLAGYPSNLENGDLTVRVTGYRYWWEMEYLDENGQTAFTTANELHVPLGGRVRLELRAADVIHSFWVPRLAGKTDLIPGQRNVLWLEGDQLGSFTGQCAEFCGQSHAQMGIRVVVDTPGAYAAWVDREQSPAAAQPADAAGMELLQSRGCAACHTIRGTSASGQAGPDLTHVGSRATLAAGVLPNRPEAMAAWLSNPDSVKPGTLMPDANLAPDEITQLVGLLESFQ